MAYELLVFLLLLAGSRAQLSAMDGMEILIWHNQQRGSVNATNMLEMVRHFTTIDHN